MIRKEFEKFEKKFIAEEKVDFIKNIEIFENLLRFAREMKKLPPENPLEGIEIDEKYAKGDKWN
ncbi:MAG: hypothetical protein NZ879_03925 [Archaeoglobaceae archaeon]|nr:hypothetical protein [Archaeoglobaceae archaeon]MDW8118111.1 hypothetical protein [Archaeoglobaceae archaeon]